MLLVPFSQNVELQNKYLVYICIHFGSPAANNNAGNRNESYLLMTSLPPILPPIGRYHNRKPIELHRREACVYDVASGILKEYTHAPPAEGTVPIYL